MLRQTWLTLTVTFVKISLIFCDFTLTVLHTNDVHARFEEMSTYGGPCHEKDSQAGRCFGGIARRMTKLRQFRNKSDHVVLLDAGDQFQGTLWFLLHKGDAAAYFMNLLEYDVMALGNHEFDNGISGLIPFLQKVNFPVLCCNIDTSQEPEIEKWIKRSSVLDIGGRRVGVIGYITKDASDLSNTGKLTFLDEIPSIQAEVDRLEASGVDMIIGLGHGGYKLDLKIAAGVSGLDLVIGGHTNTFLYKGDSPSIEKPLGQYPTVVTQPSGHMVLVLEDYAFGKYLGHLDLTFDDLGQITDWNGNPILLDNSIKQDPDVLKAMVKWRGPVKDISNQVIGQADVFLDGSRESCRLRECNMGDLVTDAMLYRFSSSQQEVKPAHAAIINGGAVRSSLEQGDITMADIQTVQPFRNTFDVMEIYGRDLRRILELSVSGYDVIEKRGRFLQIAGLRVLYNITEADGHKVKDVCIRSLRSHVNFEPLADDSLYRIVITAFLAKGGDGYSIIKEKAVKINIFESLDVEITMSYIRDNTPITTALDGRIAFTEEDSASWRCEPSVLEVRGGASRFTHNTWNRLCVLAIVILCNYGWSS